jgi:DNA-binding NtrC family response regulator
MPLDDVLSLSHGSRTLVRHRLDDRPVEIGSGRGCDLAVPSAAVAPRSLLVYPLHGSVFAFDLAETPGLGERRTLPVGAPVELGDGYRLVRQRIERDSSDEPETIVAPHAASERVDLELVAVLRGPKGSTPVGEAPVSIGSAPDNRIIAADRAVSRYHCRVEPHAYGVTLRDLDSTNGTWVDGSRIHKVELRVGACLRVGKTTLRVVERDRDTREGVVAASHGMRAVMSEVDRVASLPWPVLIGGETGVGKEVVARAIHRRGVRCRGPFVALNMGGLARDLVESELFGHERGAFTGAVKSRRGAFEQAHRGTLFLDEIAELPVALQARLLRVLDTHRVRRLGSESERTVDVRVVCATHANLSEAVRRRTFREDLFYRIHRWVIRVPPLRKRTADIPPLADHLLGLMRSDLGTTELGPRAVERLMGHPWPGNVRELRNVLEVAALESDGGRIDVDAVERALRRTLDPAACPTTPDVLRQALTRHGGNVSATARALGLPRTTLRDRLRIEGIGA